jgi:hypothetical protein
MNKPLTGFEQFFNRPVRKLEKLCVTGLADISAQARTNGIIRARGRFC